MIAEVDLASLTLDSLNLGSAMISCLSPAQRQRG